jgi:hypothetical protein
MDPLAPLHPPLPLHLLCAHVEGTVSVVVVLLCGFYRSKPDSGKKDSSRWVLYAGKHILTEF